MLPFLGTSFPAFLGFHYELNTFAVTKTAQPFSSTFDDDVGVQNPHHQDNLLGFFTIRSCDDNNVSTVVQLNGRVPFSHVFINAVQAELAGFTEGQEVILDPVHHTVCESVEIIPLTAGDFDVLDKNSVIVEDELLQQISVVRRGMLLPFWVSPSIVAKFRIGKIIPDTDLPVILHNSSELLIAPVSPSPMSPSGMPRGGDNKGISIAKVDSMLRSVSGTLNLFRKDAASPPVNLVLRCLPRDMWEKSKQLQEFLSSNPSVIFALDPGSHYTLYDVVRVVNATDLKAHNFAILSRLPETSEALEGIFKEARDALKDKPGHCICSSSWNLDYVGVHLTAVGPKKYRALNSVSVQVAASDAESVETSLRSSLLSQTSVFPLVFGADGIHHSLQINGGYSSIFLAPGEKEAGQSQDHNETCFALTPDTNVEVEVVASLPKSTEEKPAVTNYGLNSSLGNQSFEFQAAIVEDCAKLVNLHFSRPKIPAKILILGPAGSGKTALITRVSRLLAHSNRGAFSSLIDCNSWKGKQADSIEKVCRAEMKKLEARRPAVLLLDNLDFFQLQNEDEQRQIGIEKIFQMIRRFILSAKVPVIVTARKRTTLHKCLVTAGGIRLFNHVFEIAPLTQAQRENILRELIEPDCDVSAAAKVTENFTVADLKKLAIRVQVEAAVRGASTPSADDVAKALSHSRPAGHVIQNTRNERKWSLQDVGGMASQKQLLTEVMLWPTKYAELFDNCGIKLGRGVLLHGASGCGKTLLARAFSDETHFNVISVKGPELLSKYIGSSEENVRQVFERARASAPCIILFDELDSLAPRRGSDSTGVTDRVVNQLLTELDGAEGLHGVFVIGCTSRLDLIDPALIRPGRFDHLVECAFPNEDDRKDILSVILRDVPHSDDVRPAELAARSDGWTGADLKALITNAKFEAARQIARDGTKTPLSVSLEAVNAVFEDSKPKERSQRQEIVSRSQGIKMEGSPGVSQLKQLIGEDGSPAPPMDTDAASTVVDEATPLRESRLGTAIDNLMTSWYQVVNSISGKPPVPGPYTVEHAKEVAEIDVKQWRDASHDVNTELTRIAMQWEITYPNLNYDDEIRDIKNAISRQEALLKRSQEVMEKRTDEFFANPKD